MKRSEFLRASKAALVVDYERSDLQRSSLFKTEFPGMLESVR